MEKLKCFVYSFKVFALCVLLGLIIALLCFFVYGERNSTSTVFSEKSILSVIIDPGHGGKDGGASSKSGVLEKDLNLKMAIALKNILKLCDVKVVMTRENDSLACDENDSSLKGKVKATDLKNRVEFSVKNPDSLFVSIHMNKFSVEKYKGLQVYYSTNNKGSFSLAESIQNNVVKLLQSDNNRKVKAASSNIYILNRIKIPAVLVECGFLSNNEETELLCNATYRCKLSLVLADSILTNLLNNLE